MKTFKKILCVTLAFLLLLAGLSALMIEPMIQSESAYYLDAGVRDALAGSIDYIFIGDSDGMTAFDPRVFDEQTGKNSYNLSGTMMTAGSMDYLLQLETARNPVETVVIQISLEMLNRNYANEKGDGDSVTLQRLNTVSDKVKFLTGYVTLDDWLNIYSRLLVSGLADWKYKLLGEDNDKVDYSLKGYHIANANNQELTEEQAVECYNTACVGIDNSSDYYDKIRTVAENCLAQGVNVEIVILPVSNSHIWEYDHWEVFTEWMDEFTESLGITYHDFNLYKDKYTILSDSISYKDYAHMSEAGAEAFTTAFAAVYNAETAGENTSDLFYDSYEEMKKDSPYRKYLAE